MCSGAIDHNELRTSWTCRRLQDLSISAVGGLRWFEINSGVRCAPKVLSRPLGVIRRAGQCDYDNARPINVRAAAHNADGNNKMDRNAAISTSSSVHGCAHDSRMRTVPVALNRETGPGAGIASESAKLLLSFSRQWHSSTTLLADLHLVTTTVRHCFCAECPCRTLPEFCCDIPGPNWRPARATMQTTSSFRSVFCGASSLHTSPTHLWQHGSAHNVISTGLRRGSRLCAR